MTPQTKVSHLSPPISAVNSVVRASEGYFLQLVKLLSEMTDGDIVKGVLLVTIVYANTEIIRRMDGNTHAFASIDEIPTDDMRQPVSVYALSKSLGTPYETTRRYVNQMVEDGLCEKAGAKGGVIVPARVLSSARARAISTRHFAQSMKFVDRVNELSGR